MREILRLIYFTNLFLKIISKGVPEKLSKIIIINLFLKKKRREVSKNYACQHLALKSILDYLDSISEQIERFWKIFKEEFSQNFKTTLESITKHIFVMHTVDSLKYANP